MIYGGDLFLQAVIEKKTGLSTIKLQRLLRRKLNRLEETAKEI
jgi:hypothetical protein